MSGIALLMTEVVSGAPRVVVGIGASAGGIEPLRRILGDLDPGLPAAVLVVVHLHPGTPSVLDAILRRCCSLPVAFASTGMDLEAGRVYLAPPDLHMTVADGSLAVDRGPTVNAVRPSVDVLFRSMAGTYGHRGVGVVISGALDDGAVGLRAIKHAGGTAIVQDPADALFPSMPTAAGHMTRPDAVAGVDRIGGVVTEAVYRLAGAAGKGGPAVDDPPSGDEGIGHPPGQPSELACPECGGVLWEQPDEVLRFRCRIGYSCSTESLVSRHSQKLEEVLWSAVVALEERADLFRRVGRRLSGRSAVSPRYERDARAASRDAKLLRSVVMALENRPFPVK